MKLGLSNTCELCSVLLLGVNSVKAVTLLSAGIKEVLLVPLFCIYGKLKTNLKRKEESCNQVFSYVSYL